MAGGGDDMQQSHPIPEDDYVNGLYNWLSKVFGDFYISSSFFILMIEGSRFFFSSVPDSDGAPPSAMTTITAGGLL